MFLHNNKLSFPKKAGLFSDCKNIIIIADGQAVFRQKRRYFCAVADILKIRDACIVSVDKMGNFV